MTALEKNCGPWDGFLVALWNEERASPEAIQRIEAILLGSIRRSNVKGKATLRVEDPEHSPAPT